MNGVWFFFSLFMIFSSLRHLLYDMKNWKVSVILQKMLYLRKNQSTFNSKCSKYELMIYRILIAGDIIFPTLMFLSYVFTKEEDKNAKILIYVFYSLWTLTVASSLYFLLTAYYQINDKMVELSQGQVRKVSIALQVVAFFLTLAMIFLPLITDFDHQDALITIVILIAVF